MNLNNDILNETLNYLSIENIYKLKLLNHSFNNFIEKEFVLINYYGNKINKNIIDKHGENLKSLVLRPHKNLIDETNDEYLLKLNKLKKLVLPQNKNITDKGLEYIPNVKILNLNSNTNITDNGLKYISNTKILKLQSNKNITDNGLKYISNIKILMMVKNYNITFKGLEYIPKLKKLHLLTIR